MTEDQHVKQRFARLNAARDLQRPTEMNAGPTVTAMRGQGAVSAAQKDSLVPRSAQEQAAFEARQAAQPEASGKPSFVWRALRFVGLVFQKLDLKIDRSTASGKKAAHTGSCEHMKRVNEASIRDYDAMYSPSYSYLGYNVHHRSD